MYQDRSILHVKASKDADKVQADLPWADAEKAV